MQDPITLAHEYIHAASDYAEGELTSANGITSFGSLSGMQLEVTTRRGIGKTEVARLGASLNEVLTESISHLALAVEMHGDQAYSDPSLILNDKTSYTPLVANFMRMVEAVEPSQRKAFWHDVIKVYNGVGIESTTPLERFNEKVDALANVITKYTGVEHTRDQVIGLNFDFEKLQAVKDPTYPKVAEQKANLSQGDSPEGAIVAKAMVALEKSGNRNPSNEQLLDAIKSEQESFSKLNLKDISLWSTALMVYSLHQGESFSKLQNPRWNDLRQAELSEQKRIMELSPQEILNRANNLDTVSSTASRDSVVDLPSAKDVFTPCNAPDPHTRSQEAYGRVTALREELFERHPNLTTAQISRLDDLLMDEKGEYKDGLYSLIYFNDGSESYKAEIREKLNEIDQILH